MFLFPNKGHVVYLPDAGKGSAVCSSLHCGTRYLIAVLARPTAQVPRLAGNVSGGPGSIPGRFWRIGVPSFRRCSAQPLHSGSVKYRDVVRPLHRPLHYRVRGWGRLKKKKLNGKPNVLCWFFVVHKLCLHMHMNEGKFEGNSSRE